MSPQEIRLEILKLLRMPDIASPDITQYVNRAKALEAYVVGAGQAIEPLPKPTLSVPQPQARTPLPLQNPARK